jgi:hypothetical protein
MSILNRLFGSKVQSDNRKPFHRNFTREEREDWFAHTPPWNQVEPTVVDAILDGFTDKTLLEEFVLISMKADLVPDYALLGREETDPSIIRVHVAQILCRIGNRAVVNFKKAMKAGEKDTMEEAAILALGALQPATMLGTNQVAAYAGMAALYSLVGKRAKSHRYAERGLIELEELRREASADAADVLDQVERRLLSYLED